MARSRSYTYSDAGFNGFLRRTITSNPMATTLRQPGMARQNTINFDNMQVSGSLGDKFTVGNIVIDGVKGVIDLPDENGNVVIRIGELDA